jgi:hypothetical protein
MRMANQSPEKRDPRGAFGEGVLASVDVFIVPIGVGSSATEAACDSHLDGLQRHFLHHLATKKTIFPNGERSTVGS